MATKKVTNPHAIYYRDGGYLIFDITNDDYKAILSAMQKKTDNFIVDTSVGIMNVHDMRAVIKQKPPAKPKKTEGALPSDLSQEDIEWVTLQRQLWKGDMTNE